MNCVNGTLSPVERAVVADLAAAGCGGVGCGFVCAWVTARLAATAMAAAATVLRNGVMRVLISRRPTFRADVAVFRSVL
jgi:uncharacterized membrane protein YcjF (UPF0283 family)